MFAANFPGKSFLVLCLAGGLLSLPAFAEKPAWAGHGKHGQGGGGQEHKQRHYSHEQRHSPRNMQEYSSGDDHVMHGSGLIQFTDQQRGVAYGYYGQQFQRGACPPGLARKHNGCMPPGQAKKWQIGYRLPPAVVYYDLSPQVRVQMGVPPAGYRYVRVASDILMIAAGTGMVIDAIQDLHQMH